MTLDELTAIENSAWAHFISFYDSEEKAQRAYNDVFPIQGKAGEAAHAYWLATQATEERLNEMYPGPTNNA